MTTHTPGPWNTRFSGSHGREIVQPDSLKGVIAVLGERETDEEELANGRRIVACVNACKDISDPEFEIPQLLQYKANLLKALEETVPRDALKTYRDPDNILQKETP